MASKILTIFKSNTKKSRTTKIEYGKLSE